MSMVISVGENTLTSLPFFFNIARKKIQFILLDINFCSSLSAAAGKLRILDNGAGAGVAVW